MTLKDNFEIITINIPTPYNELLILLKKRHLYTSKTEIIRTALRDFFLKEIELIQAINDKHVLNELLKIVNINKFKKELSNFEKEINKRIIGVA